MSQKDNNKITITIDKDWIAPAIFIILMLVLLGYCARSTYLSFKYQEMYSNNAKVEDTSTETYVNKRLNFMMSYPKDWKPNNIEDNVLSAMMDVIDKNGPQFNMYSYKLPAEIAPVVFTATDKLSSSYTQFMSLSLRGSNINLNDLSTLKEPLLEELKVLVSAVDVEEVTPLESNYVDGYLTLRLKTKIDDTLTIYYTQVSTIIGYNLVTLIHGTSDPNNDLTFDMCSMLSNLIVTGNPPEGAVDCTKEPLGTESLAPRTLPANMQLAVQELIEDSEKEELVEKAESAVSQDGVVSGTIEGFGDTVEEGATGEGSISQDGVIEDSHEGHSHD